MLKRVPRAELEAAAQTPGATLEFTVVESCWRETHSTLTIQICDYFLCYAKVIGTGHYVPGDAYSGQILSISQSESLNHPKEILNFGRLTRQGRSIAAQRQKDGTFTLGGSKLDYLHNTSGESKPTEYKETFALSQNRQALHLSPKKEQSAQTVANTRQLLRRSSLIHNCSLIDLEGTPKLTFSSNFVPPFPIELDTDVILSQLKREAEVVDIESSYDDDDSQDDLEFVEKTPENPAIFESLSPQVNTNIIDLSSDSEPVSHSPVASTPRQAETGYDKESIVLEDSSLEDSMSEPEVLSLDEEIGEELDEKLAEDLRKPSKFHSGEDSDSEKAPQDAQSPGHAHAPVEEEVHNGSSLGAQDKQITSETECNSDDCESGTSANYEVSVGDAVLKQSHAQDNAHIIEIISSSDDEAYDDHLFIAQLPLPTASNNNIRLEAKERGGYHKNPNNTHHGASGKHDSTETKLSELQNSSNALENLRRAQPRFSEERAHQRQREIHETERFTRAQQAILDRKRLLHDKNVLENASKWQRKVTSQPNTVRDREPHVEDELLSKTPIRLSEDNATVHSPSRLISLDQHKGPKAASKSAQNHRSNLLKEMTPSFDVDNILEPDYASKPLPLTTSTPMKPQPVPTITSTPVLTPHSAHLPPKPQVPTATSTPVSTQLSAHLPPKPSFIRTISGGGVSQPVFQPAASLPSKSHKALTPKPSDMHATTSARSVPSPFFQPVASSPAVRTKTPPKVVPSKPQTSTVPQKPPFELPNMLLASHKASDVGVRPGSKNPVSGLSQSNNHRSQVANMAQPSKVVELSASTKPHSSIFQGRAAKAPVFNDTGPNFSLGDIEGNALALIFGKPSPQR